MSLIQLSKLTFAYEGSYDNIFEDVSLQLDTDWRLGFTGRNGRGKTTLLKLLMGEYEYRGSISSSVDFQYFPFPVADTGQTTRQVALGQRDVQEWALLRELHLLEVADDVLDRPFCTLSQGEQTKALLAALFLGDNAFLLIDEPTNHLDAQGRQTVSRYLKSKKGFILVSHDRAFLDGAVDHILSINRTNIEVQRGNFSSWWENKERQDQFELAQNETLKKDIRRLKQAARQSKNWADKVESTKIGMGAEESREYIGEQSRRMQQRRKNLERRQHAAIDEKAGLLKNIEEADSLKLHPLSYHSSTLAVLEDVAIFYGERQVCGNVSFSIETGDRIALSGKNGSGKTSILKLLRGDAFSYTGNVQRGSGLVISEVSQDTAFLQGDLSAFAALHGIDESLFKAILRKLDFSRVQFEKDMADFSGGQKKKVLIAKSLCQKAHLYIWDEPLNFIDVLSRMQLEKLLKESHATILFVEHDAYFANSIATKQISL